MGCKCATYDPEDGRYQCSVSGSGCVYMIPNSKACARDYGEGPDVPDDPDNPPISEEELEEELDRMINENKRTFI